MGHQRPTFYCEETNEEHYLDDYGTKEDFDAAQESKELFLSWHGERG